MKFVWILVNCFVWILVQCFEWIPVNCFLGLMYHSLRLLSGYYPPTKVTCTLFLFSLISPFPPVSHNPLVFFSAAILKSLPRFLVHACRSVSITLFSYCFSFRTGRANNISFRDLNFVLIPDFVLSNLGLT